MRTVTPTTYGERTITLDLLTFRVFTVLALIVGAGIGWGIR